MTKKKKTVEFDEVEFVNVALDLMVNLKRREKIQARIDHDWSVLSQQTDDYLKHNPEQIGSKAGKEK